MRCPIKHPEDFRFQLSRIGIDPSNDTLVVYGYGCLHLLEHIVHLRKWRLPFAAYKNEDVHKLLADVFPEATEAFDRNLGSSDYWKSFSSVCWIFPNRLQSQRCFYHTAVQTLPLPADSFQFIVLFQTFCPYFFKKARCKPLLERPMYGAPAAIFPGQGFPLTARSQHIEYPLQGFPCRHWLASLSRCMNIVLFRISFRFRNIFLDPFPKFV